MRVKGESQQDYWSERNIREEEKRMKRWKRVFDLIYMKVRERESEEMRKNESEKEGSDSNECGRWWLP